MTATTENNTKMGNHTHYGRPGHEASNCWHNPKRSAYKQRNANIYGRGGRGGLDRRRPGKSNNSEGVQPVPFHTKTIQSETEHLTSNSTLVLECAGTAHITHDRSPIRNFKPAESQVQLGNKQFMELLGYGDIMRRPIYWETQLIVLRDVFCVPGILQNLVSVSQCLRNECKSEIDDLDSGPRGFIPIIHKAERNEVLIGLESKAGLYKTEIKVDFLVTQAFQLSIKKEDECELLHRSLGHIGSTTISKSAKIVHGIKIPSPKRWKTRFLRAMRNFQVNKKYTNNLD